MAAKVSAVLVGRSRGYDAPADFCARVRSPDDFNHTFRNPVRQKQLFDGVENQPALVVSGRDYHLGGPGMEQRK